ncbi:MAG: HAD family hydrolase [Bacteroidales bacterium]|nr:HAD family hydrolase [Bacteroidales bacterium]MDD3431184.1 HAD family hydrolase [Bacteroidales bacterium]MDD4362256.1 HAD family hydrolase [Bacteroidales bacterium]MDD4431650.1 HAD family hydrolase [Bacteroidales bacterium]
MIAPKALIFDLDGTLIDSLQDIADAMNRVLTAQKLPSHSYAEYKEFIGRGLKNLVERCLPEDQQNEELQASCHEALIREYSKHFVVKTDLYPGIRELLEQISLKYAGGQQDSSPASHRTDSQAGTTSATPSAGITSATPSAGITCATPSAGITGAGAFAGTASTARHTKRFPMAILSNKADEITQLIARQLGLTAYFDLILGATPRFPRKPDTQSSLYLAEQLGCRPAEVLYIGDSGVDMQTAKNAGMTALGVSWGFRSRQELLDNGADYVVDTPAEILDLLKTN